MNSIEGELVGNMKELSFQSPFRVSSSTYVDAIPSRNLGNLLLSFFHESLWILT